MLDVKAQNQLGYAIAKTLLKQIQEGVKLPKDKLDKVDKIIRERFGV